MSSFQSAVGIALLCDEQGIIRVVIRDGIGLQGLAAGQPLEKLVDSSSRFKLLNFLIELRGKGGAFGWEVNIANRDQIFTLSLAGTVSKGDLMIIGVQTPYDALSLCDELMKTNPEQAIDLRTFVWEQVINFRMQNHRDDDSFNEISRLNNELINLQRDLAKKNAELELLYAEVQQQAITDSLTGLYNRRGFFEFGNREVIRAKRYQRFLSAIMLDLDDFKKVNDTLGHPVGDKVLAETAQRCLRRLRKSDIVGRYGGEEFSILLPETAPEDAYNVAESLRRNFEEPFEIGNATLTVTISVGVAGLKDNISSLLEMLEGADRALYTAKRSGRNCVRVDS